MHAHCCVDHSEWQHHQLMTQSVIPICRYRGARATRNEIKNCEVHKIAKIGKNLPNLANILRSLC